MRGEAKVQHPQYTVLTVSRKVAARVNRIVLEHAFAKADPLTDITLEGQLDTILYPFKGLNIMITKNLDKPTGVVNGQVATIIGNEGCTLLLQFPNKQKTFTYPVSTQQEDETWRTTYALVPSYAMTISKSEVGTIDKLLVWMDCTHVPEGLGYVALSSVGTERHSVSNTNDPNAIYACPKLNAKSLRSKANDLLTINY